MTTCGKKEKINVTGIFWLNDLLNDKSIRLKQMKT